MASKKDHFIISVSGGLASAACAIVAHEEGLNFDMLFADTLIEDEDLYRFIDDLEAKLDRPIIRLKDGRDPWQVFVDRRYIGNTRTAHCSKDLKTKQVREWVDANATPASKIVLGMYRDEEDRLYTANRNWNPYKVCSLLINGSRPFGGVLWKTLYPKDVERLVVGKYGIKQPRLYDMGFPHNNCGGFCVRAGQGQFATLLERMPERYAEHEAKQEETMSAIGPTARSFLRVTIDGKLCYLTLREFREMIEAGDLQPKMYEMGGCGCFVDD